MHIVAQHRKYMGKRQGKLTVFFSYFSGAGKSYTMLQIAEVERRAGVDVVVGLLSCEAWPQTKLLAEKFEVIACKTIGRDGQTTCEMDLDACLKREPELILIDDLSHLNADDSRHMKRYQDIEELLKAGIDVYTTMNIQHVESIQDSISSVMGSAVSEQVPDCVLDRAARVEFIDIEPERLQRRLLRQNKGELLAGCTLSQLNALREIGLRRCADRAALYSQEPHHKMESCSREHVLACLSAAPSDEKIICFALFRGKMCGRTRGSSFGVSRLRCVVRCNRWCVRLLLALFFLRLRSLFAEYFTSLLHGFLFCSCHSMDTLTR